MAARAVRAMPPVEGTIPHLAIRPRCGYVLAFTRDGREGKTDR